MFFKRRLAIKPIKKRRIIIGKGHKLSIVKQCELLSIHRSSFYYKPRGESELILKLMRLMDEHYLEHLYKELEECIYDEQWIRASK